jgi:hypothetical protein
VVDRSRFKALKAAWQFAPLGLVAAWGFLQAVLFLAGLIDLSWFQDLAVPIQPAFQAGVASLWQALFALLQFGWLNGLIEPFAWLDLNSPLLSIILLDLGLSVFTLVLLGGWMASWWAFQNSPQLAVLRSE